MHGPVQLACCCICGHPILPLSIPTPQDLIVDPKKKKQHLQQLKQQQNQQHSQQDSSSNVSEAADSSSINDSQADPLSQSSNASSSHQRSINEATNSSNSSSSYFSNGTPVYDPLSAKQQVGVMLAECLSPCPQQLQGQKHGLRTLFCYHQSAWLREHIVIIASMWLRTSSSFGLKPSGGTFNASSAVWSTCL